MSKKFFIGSLLSAFLFGMLAFAPATQGQSCPPCAPLVEPQCQLVDQCAPCAPQVNYDCNPCVNNYTNCFPNTYKNNCFGSAFQQKHVLYARAEAVFWNIDDGNKRPLIMRAISNQTVFSAKDIDYGTEAAPRITLGLHISPYTAVEGQYMGLFNLRDRSYFTGASDLILPGDLGTVPGDYFNADAMNVSSETDMHSVEFNFVRRTQMPNISWLAGFRYVNFEEKFELNSTPVLAAPHWSSDYRLQTKNDLYGGQLGLKSEFALTDRFGLQFVGKAGVYSNRARQSNWMGNENNDPRSTLRDAKAKSTKTSFLGELNIGAYAKITDNLQIVGGYNLMWISDMARAADQMDFTHELHSGQSLETDTLFMHGANVGVELRF